ncbi:MAG: TIR domain-containing protein [Anaerolineae bacterium]|nr:TIR domain-containing protein [Anaerolineae bacterium]
MARIFISYSRVDETFARRLAGDLSRLGADVWIDVQDIPAGMDWSNAIQQGLDSAEVMLVLLSPESTVSENVEDEWKYFKDQDKPLIPIMVRPAKVHFQLHRLQYIDFHDQPYDAALTQLREELARQSITLQPTRKRPPARTPTPVREQTPSAPPPPPTTIKPPQEAAPSRDSAPSQTPVPRKTQHRLRTQSWRTYLVALLLIGVGAVGLFVALSALLGGDDEDGDDQRDAIPFVDPDGEALIPCDEADFAGLHIAYISDGLWNPAASTYTLPLAAAEAAAECGATLVTEHPHLEEDLHVVVEEVSGGDFQIVILTGGRLAEAAFDIIPQRPDIWFITADLDHAMPLDNMINVTAHEHEAGFLAGVLAGHLATTPGVGGVFGSLEDPAQANYRDGFAEGVHSVNPELTALTQHHPGNPDEAFDDPSRGQNMAHELLDQHASVIFAPSHVTGDGALVATAAIAAGADGPPPFCIGAQSDRWQTLPEARPCLISSVVPRYDLGVAEAILIIASGDVRTNLIYAPITLAPFRDHADHLPPETMEALNAIE